MQLRAILLLLLLSSAPLIAQKKTDTLFRGSSKLIESITITEKNKKIIIRYSNQNKIASEETYVNEKLHGLKKRYNYNGFLEEEIEYKEGKKNGNSKEYIQNGGLKITSEYKNDTLNGLQIKYYDIGTIQSKENFVNGYKIGKCEYYFKSGKISAKHTFDTISVQSGAKKEKKINSVLHGHSQAWYESGFKKSEENYIKGKKNGTFKEWYENGKLKFVNNYVHDARTGRQLNYHKNGNLQEDVTIELEYDSIKKYNKTYYRGKYLKYDENKKPLVIGFYKDRKKHGVWQEFSNGKISMDAEYKNGYLINTFKAYYPNTAQLSRVVHYKETKINSKDTSCIDGESISYHQSGNISAKLLYNNCRCISSISYQDNGSLSNRTELKDSMVHKTDYHKNGKIATKSIAKYNPEKDIAAQKFELITSYFDNGQIKEDFSNALNPIRIKKEYNDSGLVIYQKYNILDQIGIETDFYHSGALKSEKISFSNHYKAPGMQYIEWFENGKPKHFETYGFYQINWLSDGTFYNSFAYKNYNNNTPKDTVIDPAVINELYNSLIKSTKRKIELENTEGRTFSTYDDKKVKIEAFVQNGIITNYLRAYFFSGKPMLEFSLTDGELDGPYKQYLENGALKESGNYCKGKLCGIWLECNLNGDTLKYYEYAKPVSKNDYNKLYTFKKEYYSSTYNGKYSNKLKSVNHYKDGKMEGYQAEYHPNGTLNYNKMFVNGIQTGAVKSFWHNGFLYEEYTLDSAGNKQGSYKRGLESGKPLVHSTYRNNKLDGAYKHFWPNGKLRSEGKYEDDKKVGEWKMYDSTGVITKTDSYAGGAKKTYDEINICNCKTEQKKIGFAPRISDLMDISRGDIWQFGFHEPITKYMDKLFYMSFQTDQSSSGGSRFASMDVISFQEISTRIPDSKGLQLVLNPCHKFQEHSRISINANIVKNQPNETSIEINSEMFAFKFDPKLLKPVHPKIKETESCFKVSYMNYSKDGIKLHKPESIGFTPSLLTGTKAFVELSSFIPCINESSYQLNFIQTDLLYNNKLLKKEEITGIINGEGFLRSVDSTLKVPLTHVLITENFFAGEIILNQSATTASGTMYKINNTNLSEEKAIDMIFCLFNNNTSFATKKEQNKLIISFLIRKKP